MPRLDVNARLCPLPRFRLTVGDRNNLPVRAEWPALQEPRELNSDVAQDSIECKDLDPDLGSETLAMALSAAGRFAQF